VKNYLVHFNKARQELALAKEIDEVKEIRDRAEALRMYAKQAGDSLDMQNHCAEIKIRAERRAGEMLVLQPKQHGARPADKSLVTGLHHATPSLKELGIEKTQSHRWQKIASIPEEIFEKHIKEIKTAKKELTSMEFAKLATKINQELKREKLKERSLPQSKFQVIYADPPWEYRNSGFPMSAQNKYPTMSVDRIAALNVKEISDEDSILFLWVTNPILEDAFKVIGMWGFEYKTNMVWIKSVHTAGFYVFGQHELLLIATRGSMTAIEKKPKSIIYGKNTVHSRKPESVYEIIEGMYPNLNYIELFARKTRDGWSSWGNEIPEGCTDKNKEIS